MEQREPIGTNPLRNRFSDILAAHRFILTEAAVIEALQRSSEIAINPHLANALLIYDPKGRAALSRLYVEFVAIAQQARVPVVLTTPTWRAGRERIERAGAPLRLNQDAVTFLRHLRAQARDRATAMAIGGLLGPKNDAYQPCQGLSAAAAETYHQWQARQLVDGGVDFLMAATLPALPEAKGIALAMGRTGVPYVVSVVLGADGRLLDGTPLEQAVIEIDAQSAQRPAGFMINCDYPSFLKRSALSPASLKRILGFQANAAARNHEALDAADGRLAEPVADWGDRMIALHRDLGIKILGGCCGTRGEHLRYLALRLGSKT